MGTHNSLLLVEDDRLDAAIMRRCLKQLNISCELVHKTDGEQALEYLCECHDRVPCAILLDLNMPRMNGVEFLEHLKANQALRNIPVFVVTTSSASEDREACFRLGVADYITKDWEFDTFVESMRTIEKYCACASVASDA